MHPFFLLAVSVAFLIGALFMLCVGAIKEFLIGAIAGGIGLWGGIAGMKERSETQVAAMRARQPTAVVAPAPPGPRLDPAPSSASSAATDAHRARVRRLAEALADLRATIGASLPESQARAAYLREYLAARKAYQPILDDARPGDARPVVREAREAMAAVEAVAAIYRRAEEMKARQDQSQGRRARTVDDVAAGLNQSVSDLGWLDRASADLPGLKLDVLRKIDALNEAVRTMGDR